MYRSFVPKTWTGCAVLGLSVSAMVYLYTHGRDNPIGRFVVDVGRALWWRVKKFVMKRLWFRVDEFAEATAIAMDLAADGDIDDHLERDPDGNEHTRRVRVGRRSGFCAQVSRELKISFPFMSMRPTVADYLTVQRAAQLLMTQRGMRPAHIKKHIHLVVASVFTPSKDEMEAVGVLQSQFNGDLRREYAMATAPTFWMGVFGGSSRYPFHRD
jgi:hypothetical protein